MRLKTVLFSLMAASLIFSSCKKDIACTEEYRYITITVQGEPLDAFYTIRDCNADTIRYAYDSLMGHQTYVVLADNYQPEIRNKTEHFSFKGFINNSLVVDEPFVIKANDCHIEYVSGNTTVQL